VVSNAFAKSIGLGGSKAIRAKSITQGAGCRYAPDHSGDQNDAKVISCAAFRKGRSIPAAGPTKGHGGNVDKRATTKDPLQKGGSRYAE
jgi:hypothetical protein